MARTPPFQGENRGSIPLCDAKFNKKMKRTFRIVEIKDEQEKVYYIVQQRYFKFFWAKAEFNELTTVMSSYDGALYRYIQFESMKAARLALQQVKEVMKKIRGAHKKVMDTVTISVD